MRTFGLRFKWFYVLCWSLHVFLALQPPLLRLPHVWIILTLRRLPDGLTAKSSINSSERALFHPLRLLSLSTCKITSYFSLTYAILRHTAPNAVILPTTEAIHELLCLELCNLQMHSCLSLYIGLCRERQFEAGILTINNLTIGVWVNEVRNKYYYIYIIIYI